MTPPANRTGLTRLFIVFCAVWAVLVLYAYPFRVIERDGWTLNEFPHWMSHQAGHPSPNADGRDWIMASEREWMHRSDISRWVAVMSWRGHYILLALVGVPAIAYWVWRGFIAGGTDGGE